MGARGLAAVAGAVVILATGIGGAESAVDTLDAHLSVEWDAGWTKDGSPTISGYVRSSRGWHAENVRLQVEALDAEGQVVGKTVVYVNRQIPPFGDAYFSARLAPGAAYRFTLISVDWRSRPSTFRHILPRIAAP